MVARNRILQSMLERCAPPSVQEGQPAFLAVGRVRTVTDLVGLLTMVALVVAYLIARL